MTFRNHTPTLLTLALLTACQPAPAHADAFDPASVPPDPARPGWRPPVARPYVPSGGSHFDYNPESGALPLEDLQDDLWLSPFGTFGSWGEGTASIPLPPPPVVTRKPCRPVPEPEGEIVPGPLPIAGAAAAWGWARRLRRRVGR